MNSKDGKQGEVAKQDYTKLIDRWVHYPKFAGGPYWPDHPSATASLKHLFPRHAIRFSTAFSAQTIH
jgi:hypothetical protein